MHPAPEGPPPRWLLALVWAASAVTLAGVLLVAVLPCDWITHCWLLEQVASRWLRDGVPPLLLDTAGRTGDPWLLFYGLGVYVPLSPFAWLLGGPAGIKAAAVSLHALLGWRVVQLVWRGTGSAGVSACLSTLVLSTMYPVSTLGARGAVAEFFAYELVGVALVSLVLGWAAGPGLRAALLVEACCAATLGCLAHPPTLLLETLFLLPVLLTLLWALGPPALSATQAAIFAAALALCAITVGLFLAIVIPSLSQIDLRGYGLLGYFGGSIDHPFARLYPLPLEFLFTPTIGAHLMAPLHGTLAVVLLAGWLAAGRGRRLAVRAIPAGALGLVALLIAVVLSLPVWPMEERGFADMRMAAGDSLPSRLVAPVQFAYRLVGTQDLLLLLLACATFVRIGERDAVGAWLARSRTGWTLLVACTTLGLAAVAQQALYVVKPFTTQPGRGTAEEALAVVTNTAHMPPSFDTFGAYAMPRIFPLLGPEAGTPIAAPSGLARSPSAADSRSSARAPAPS